MKTRTRNRTVRADLFPPLGNNSGPCKVVDRIYQRVRNPVEQRALVETVERNQNLTNAQAVTIYNEYDKNPSTSKFRQFAISPHSQYRMDFRGITVPQVQKALLKLAAVFGNPKHRPMLQKLNESRNIQLNYDAAKDTLRVDDEPVRPGYERRGRTIRVDDSEYSVTFGFSGGDIVTVVTVYPKGSGDPKAPPGGCPRPRTADYRAPAGELSGVRTYPSEKPSKGIDSPSGTTIHHSPGESPRSDRERAAPMRPGQKDELLQKTPANAVFNTPGPSSQNDGQKIHVRSPGTRGEEYGHPYKLNVMPRRTEAALYPSYNERQRKQRGEAKLYYKKYYLRHRGKIRARAKRDYLHKKNKATFKKERQYRNSQKYGWRFNRLPSGGYRSPAERSRDYRGKKATVSIPFFHPNYGVGVVLDVRDQDVFIEQIDPMGGEPLGTGTVPFFTFLRGAEFEDEADIDAFFDLADEAFDSDDGGDDDEALRLATFYRETFRPGRNMDPGVGAQNLGEPSPYSPTLPYYDTDRNYRTPGEVMNNISPTDNNPGSAKVIPEGHDFENRKASAVRLAAKMAEILRGIDPGITSRARGITPKVKRRDPKNTVYSFAVPGSKGETYTVKVKGIPSGDVQTMGKMDLKLTCSCDFWQYQGPEHWAKAGDYLFGKPRGTAERPTDRDPKGRNRLCKHSVAVLDLISKWPASGKR